MEKRDLKRNEFDSGSFMCHFTFLWLEHECTDGLYDFPGGIP